MNRLVRTLCLMTGIAAVAAPLGGCIEVFASRLNTGPTSTAPAGCKAVSPPVNGLNFVCTPRPVG